MSLITISCLIVVVITAFVNSFITPGQQPGWAALIMSDVSNRDLRSLKSCKVRSRLECLTVCHRVPGSYVTTWLPASNSSSQKNCFCQVYFGTMDLKANIGAQIYQMQYGELFSHFHRSDLQSNTCSTRDVDCTNASEDGRDAAKWKSWIGH